MRAARNNHGPVHPDRRDQRGSKRSPGRLRRVSKVSSKRTLQTVPGGIQITLGAGRP